MLPRTFDNPVVTISGIELVSLKLVTILAVGRTPASAPDPWSGSRIAHETEADGGVGRGPGGPPHFVNSLVNFRDTTLAEKIKKQQ
jgi:hypothetical protein